MSFLDSWSIESLSSEEMHLYISTFLSLLLKAFLESFVRKESPHAFRSLFQCILWHLKREREQLTKAIAWKNSKGVWMALVFHNARKYMVIMMIYLCGALNLFILFKQKAFWRAFNVKKPTIKTWHWDYLAIFSMLLFQSSR